jgi:hypothetical protein
VHVESVYTSGVIPGAAQEAHHRKPTTFSMTLTDSCCPARAWRHWVRRRTPTGSHFSIGQDEPDPVLAPGDAFGELKGIVRECICYTVVFSMYVHHYRHDVKR